MNREDVFVTCVFKNIEFLVKELIYNTLEPLNSDIDMAAVNICHYGIAPLGADGYKCIILLKTKNGTTLRFVSHDRDELLALYNTLDNAVNNIRSGKMINNYDSEKGRMQTHKTH